MATEAKTERPERSTADHLRNLCNAAHATGFQVGHRLGLAEGRREGPRRFDRGIIVGIVIGVAMSWIVLTLALGLGA